MKFLVKTHTEKSVEPVALMYLMGMSVADVDVVVEGVLAITVRKETDHHIYINCGHDQSIIITTAWWLLS